MSKRELKAAERAVTVSLSHVALVCDDIPETEAWYEKILGTHSNFTNHFAGLLSFDKEHHRVALAAADLMPPLPEGKERQRLQHVAYKVDDLGALLSNYLRLKELGMPPRYCIHHTATMSFYWTDPMGIELELFIDCMTVDATNEHLEGPELENNPIGNPFDPEVLVQRYRDGDSIASLMTPPPFDPSLLGPVMEAAGLDPASLDL